MCYDLQASIRSSITSFITCYILYNNTLNQNNKIHYTFQLLALFFAFVSLMQIYDWIFWESLNKNKGENQTNYIFTKIAMITNHLQPIIYAYLVNKVHTLNSISKLVLVIYIILSFVYSIYAFNKITYTIVTDKSKPSLDWEWNFLEYSYPFYMLFLLSLTLTSLNLPYPLNSLMIVINICTFVFSYYTYKRETMGKGWCFIASYVPIFLLLIEMLFKF